MSRRVLTRSSIDELLAQGATQMQLAVGDIVTDLAKEYARDKGVRLIPAGSAPAGVIPAPAATPAAAPIPEPVVEPTPDSAVVRTAVIASLGYEPDGLDAVISRVMK